MKAPTFAVVVGVLIVQAFAACDDKEAACKVDTDCTPGLICRDTRCGPVSSDASAPPDAIAPPGTDEDSGGVTPTPPICHQLYELCQDDCCVGLSCVAGTCR